MYKKIISVSFFTELLIIMLLVPSLAAGQTCSDADSDGYGNPGDISCTNGIAVDCNDNDPAVNPGAVENCTDGIDNDCDGDVDYLDDDCAQLYMFERMWPTLQQPWYFAGPGDIALDNDGFAYVVDRQNNRIQKFNRDGVFITKWGNNGTGDGEFNTPYGIAADSSGFVYVVDYGNDRIQKFSSDGEFIAKWGNNGTGDGEFNTPYGIAVDGSGFVYVADEGNHRIQKFSSDGEFIAKWGNNGTGDGEFNCPAGIAVDSGGFVYVTDYENDRIQKFSSDGEFITKWGNNGTGDGEFNTPYGVAADGSGFVYVTDYGNNRVQKFSPDGEFIAKWGSIGRGDGEFYYPYGIAVDGSGFVYVADNANDRIQKFGPDGVFIVKWGSIGRGDGEFYYPYGIAVDGGDYIYVTDDGNHRIQKFSPDGVFITKWGSYGTGEGEFNCPSGISVDSSGFVYVVDYGNNRIQKFSPDGEFITKWGSYGAGDGEFDTPYGVAADNSGFIYVADTGNNRIQKFSPEGVFITTWGSYGTGDGNFAYPHDITADNSGYIYVTDDGNHRIQKFSSDGEFIEKWGSYGTGDGEFDRPWGISIDSIGFVYVTDVGNRRTQKFTEHGQFVTKWGNDIDNVDYFSLPSSLAVASDGRVFISDVSDNRVQVFNQVTLSSNNKAVIVAAGGPFQGNHLWDATQISANFAYQTLTYQGFNKDSIYYMTSDIDLDLDNNGVLDDVDSDVTLAELQDAINTWAADADNFILYVVDHGGSGTLRMNATEILEASDLDLWLDTLQATIPGKVIVIYDACESGSFLSALTPPSGKERIVISSTSPEQSAYFISNGSVSFSSFFWTNIFNGENLKDAFDMAASALSQAISNQIPLLDDNGNGTGNEPADGDMAQNIYIGNGTTIYGNAPSIGSVSPDQTINSTTLAVLEAYNVTDSDGISRVWGVIIPPGFTMASSDNAVQELPYIDLLNAGGDRYEATYDQFNIEGTYQIAVYARDRIGNTSIPQLTTVSVGNPLRRKAIIVAGGDQTDDNWNAAEKGALSAYNAVTFQGYTDDDIYFLSPVTFSSGVDGLSVLSNLSYAINTWAADGAWDVVLYMIGKGDDGTYDINNAETLSSADLDAWLDTLQNSIPGKVTVIYDASRSGSFHSLLTAPNGKERIVLSSTDKDEPVYFLSDGDISFSRYFWIRILNGLNVRDAYINAGEAMSFASAQKQTAVIDDNGNGIGNETGDGIIARSYSIGVGIQLAGNEPLIGSVVADQILYDSTSSTLWADGVTTTGAIDKVWAVITPPGYDTGPLDQAVSALPELILSNAGNNRYEGTYNGFSTFGLYHITIYAMDINGNMSTVQETTVHRMDAPDIYESDDLYHQANVITLNDPNHQQHNFHDGGDADWVKFYGRAEETYEIKASNLGSDNDAVIELYDTDGFALLAQVNNPGAGVDELLNWTFTLDGTYYVKVKHSDPSVFGVNTEYDLEVYIPTMPAVFGLLAGTVRDSSSSAPLSNVQVTTSYGLSDISRSDGTYIIYHPSGTYNLTADAAGYDPYLDTFTIIGSDTVIKNISMTASCMDTDNDGYGNPGSIVCTSGSALDCNDDNAAINPGESEICDGADNNCDTYIDEGFIDTDGDGVKDCVDSDDDNDGMADYADFCPLQKPSRISGTTPEYYSTLQNAYDNADDGNTIQCQDIIHTGDLDADLNKTVIIEGGYDCDYSAITGYTTINGDITTSNGSVTFDNFLLQ
jgi:streptogramin lyase